MRWRPKQRDEELARELETHLARETDANLAAGKSLGEAQVAARRKLGNTTIIREVVHEMNTIGMVESVWKDLQYAVRMMRLSPGFSLVAILSLALGIGANTAIFQLLNSLRLRSLPVERPQELVEVRIAERRSYSGSFNGRHSNFTNPLWEQIRNNQQAFSGLLAWGDRRFNLAVGGEARYAEGLWVSGDFFRVLGISPILGQVFAPTDDTRGCGSPGAVISHGFWEREFGAEPSAVGKKVTLDGHPFEVIGVTPPSFFGVEVGRRFDVAIPICSESLLAGENSTLDRRHYWWLAALGRLKPGWSAAQATAHLGALSAGIFAATLPPTFRPENAKVYLASKLAAFPAGSGVSELRGGGEAALWLLLAAAGLVLLIACANLANLMLARAGAREREIAVRLAIGASRGRLVRQLLAESLVLAGCGAALGAVLAQSLSRFLVSFLTTGQDPLFLDLSADWRLLSFTATLTILTCVLFGLTPALRATRCGPGTALKAGARGLTAGRERFSLRRMLVVSQVALSLVLLVGALLFVRSLRNLLSLETGFQQEGILIVQLDLRRPSYAPERRLAAYRELLEKLRSTPGVESAAQVGTVPVSGSAQISNVILDSTTGSPTLLQASRSTVSAGYFRTMGTPLLAGRDFDTRDSQKSPTVAIVNETFARQAFHGANPVGMRFRREPRPGEQEEVFEIVGLVKDTKYQSLREAPTPIAFLAAGQEQRPGPFVKFAVRSAVPLPAVVVALKRAIGEVNPEISIEFQALQTQIRNSLVRERLMATLSSFFGLLAGMLASIGLYGVLSYMVTRRRNEIGIRIALGADRRAITTMILAEAGLLLFLGLLLGTGLALLATRAAGVMLFGLQPHDPLTVVMAAAALSTVALVASYWPARRAAGLEPMAALREE